MSLQDYTDESGIVRLRARTTGGGTQPYVRVPLAFDTPDLAATDGASTGVVAYTPTPGDRIVWNLSYFSVPTTGFVNPPSGDVALHLTFSDLDGAFFGNSICSSGGVGAVDSADNDTGGHMTRPVLNAGGAWVYTTGPSFFPDATPLRVVLDNNAGGDPGLTAGEGVLVLYVVPAA